MSVLSLKRGIGIQLQTIWDPHTRLDIDKLEKIQGRAARFVNTNFYIENRSIFMAGEMYVFLYYVDTSIKAIYLKSMYARFCT